MCSFCDIFYNNIMLCVFCIENVPFFLKTKHFSSHLCSKAETDFSVEHSWMTCAVCLFSAPNLSQRESHWWVNTTRTTRQPNKECGFARVSNTRLLALWASTRLANCQTELLSEEPTVLLDGIRLRLLKHVPFYLLKDTVTHMQI